MALSLNLGHKNLAITIVNYYNPTPEQQFDILSKIGKLKKRMRGVSNEQILEFLKEKIK